MIFDLVEQANKLAVDGPRPIQLRVCDTDDIEVARRCAHQLCNNVGVPPGSYIGLCEDNLTEPLTNTGVQAQVPGFNVELASVPLEHFDQDVKDDGCTIS